MSQNAAPTGISAIYHPSGDIRQQTLKDGVLSGYGTAIFTGTPVKFDTNGTLIPCASGVDVIAAIFAGCEFSALGRRFVLPYWPAGQTYDVGSMIAKYEPVDPSGVFVGQTAATIAATAIGEAINLQQASQGNTFLGHSTQQLSAPTGATNGMFKIVGLYETPDNDWGDPYVWLRLMVSNPWVPVA